MNKTSDRYYNMKRQRYKSISKNLQTFLQQKINIKIIKKKMQILGIVKGEKISETILSERQFRNSRIYDPVQPLDSFPLYDHE